MKQAYGPVHRGRAAWLPGIVLMFAGAFSIPGHGADQAKAQVLFVCEHGNVKSLMAASYFNRMAAARKLPFRAVSRGSAPDSTSVPAGIVAGLHEDGFEVAAFHPEAVAMSDLAASAHLVLIGTELPANLRGHEISLEHWTDVPPASLDFDAARTSLQAHVRLLLDQLERARDW